MSGRPAKAARRRGRPSTAELAEGAPAARDRILSAARAEFAERGYEKTSIRGIARGADVDPALVHHYFGSKEEVFAAAVEGAFAPALQVPELLSTGTAEDMGERLARFMFGIWENEATREPLLAIMRSAVNNETAARIFRGLISRQLVTRVAGELKGPDATLRVELAVSQLVGSALLRYVIKVEPLASADPEELVRRLAPVVQHHLVGEPLGDGTSGA
ncbi:TetR family transcriptional regulator [Streptomyces sp. ODS28]|uniref:TetR/AcrR family transcriptional regulator n=1 Tax=Streptomyces sp. ODS28 TaxID=3136688 RepID=UPI0031E802CC